MSHSPSASDTLLFTDPFSAPIDVFGTRSRRTTSISYNSPRDRSQKQRPLLVVIPPSVLHQHHGQLGHVLSLGPTQRLPQGIVMPLYPTMYAQLTAIAREFGFPSTAGLCLYLCYSENGLTVTPRISDEAWHSLWGSVFDAPPAGRATPINGVIEFDIDLRQARWYSSWVSSSLKDPPDLPSSHTVTSDTHRRRDSRVTVDDEHVDDRRDTPTPSYSQRQHFPKKLSLLERIDPRTVQSSPSPSPEKLVALAQVLSPIVQESEPRTARQDLQTRVQSWRESAILEPTPLAVTDQLSLETANMLNTLQIDVPAEATDVLKLEDYAWSISSAGPEDRESLSSAHSDHIPSVYLEDILAGSVCSTPSVCTTIDHVDYGFDSPTNVVYGLPSPDLAQRAIESAPLTPLTATTWGAPTSYPPTPAVLTVPTTPDIGHRAFDMTPLRHSFSHYDFPPEFRIVPKSSQSSESRFHYPHLCIYPVVYPFFDLYPAVAGASLFAVSAPGQNRTALPVTLKDYPSFNLYPAVYPSLDIYPSMLQITPLSTRCESNELSVAINAQSYPNFYLYPPVYPFLDIYPPTAGDTYPLSPHAASLSTCSESNEISLSLDAQYPAFNLYPPVYPFMNIYPSVVKLDDSPPVQVELLSFSICCHSYPVFDLYPAVYPHFNLYPPVGQINSSTIADVFPLGPFSSCVYPALVIYPPVYPYFDLYPSLIGDLSISQLVTPAELVDVHLKPGYPFIDIYAPAYPHLDIYPKTEPLNYPSISAQYPSFELYPKSLNVSPPAKYLERSRSRYTHSQLHEQVFKERSLGLGRKKSHLDLHLEVFPGGAGSRITELLDESYPTPDSGNPTPLLKVALQVQDYRG